MIELPIRKAGRTLASAAEWFQEAPPGEDAAAWAPGQGEFELAKAIFDGTVGSGSGGSGGSGGAGVSTVPAELQAVLCSHAGLGPVRLSHGIPGYLVRLDEAAGGSQRCDLLAVGAGREGRVAVVVEAWSDGGFGPLIGDQLKRSRPTSQWTRRIDRLCEAVAGKRAMECTQLRGGLIHRVAAALRAAEGEKAAVAMLIFCEFRPKDGRGQQRKRNLNDLDALVAALGGTALKDGILAGPFRVPGGHEVPASVPLFIGRTVRLLPA